jgi:hypothetical protein
MDPTESDTNC